MKSNLLVFSFLALSKLMLSQSVYPSGLPDFTTFQACENKDWLVDPIECQTQVYRDGNKDLVMSNGLLLRRWRMEPEVATTHITLLTNGENFIRGVKPEARLVLNGDTVFVGGLSGQPEFGYLLAEWLDTLAPYPAAFRFDHVETGEIEPGIEWRQKRWAGQTSYPPKGKRLSFFYQHPNEKWRGVTVVVHYEMYDGIPMLCKWLSVKCEGRKELKINHFTSEILAVREEETSVDHADGLMTPNLTVQTNYAFHDMSSRFSNQAVRWLPDPDYSSQVNYLRQTP